MKRPPIVFVVWLDAHGMGVTDDLTPDDIDKLHRGWPTHTVGFLLRSDETGVTMTTDVQEPSTEVGAQPTYRGTQFVPRGMIVKEQVIGGARKPKAVA